MTAGLYLSLNALLAAVWNAPSESPVAGNAPRPLHEGIEGQVKEGSLGFMAGLSVGEFYEGMVVFGGVSKMVSFGANANLFDNTEPLTLEVGGNIGATEYCDELGNACSFIGHGVPKA